MIFLFWLFQLIFFGFFLADFWEKHKKWLIPVIVIAVLFMIPYCVYLAMDQKKDEKKKKERERQRYDNMQQFLQQNWNFTIVRTSPLCYSFRIIILIILRKYLYLRDIKATWKLNGCFAIIFVNSSKPTNITELGKLSAWRFCVHYCHVVFSKFCGFFCLFFLQIFGSRCIYFLRTNTNHCDIFVLFISVNFVCSFLWQIFGEKTRNGLYRSSLFSRS